MAASVNSPTNSRAIWPAAVGDAESAGLEFAYDHYLQDRLAIGGKTSLRSYDQVQGNVTAVEAQFGVRYHFWEYELANTPIGFFGEFMAGLQYAQGPVPERGSETNFTQDTGVGLEFFLTDTARLVGGYRIKHLSNGEIFGDENPSQNDRQIFLGFYFKIQ